MNLIWTSGGGRGNTRLIVVVPSQGLLTFVTAHEQTSSLMQKFPVCKVFIVCVYVLSFGIVRAHATYVSMDVVLRAMESTAIADMGHPVAVDVL